MSRVDVRTEAPRDEVTRAAVELVVSSIRRALDELVISLGSPPEDPPLPAPAASMRSSERSWTFRHDGLTFRLPDSKGLRQLRLLLSRPGREIHASELQALSSGAASATGAAAVSGHAGPLLDAAAKAAYRRRITELRSMQQDPGTTDRVAVEIERELEAITGELARAVGLGGRDRMAADAAERARVNVTRSLRTAIDRIADFDPALGEHLAAAVRTGVFCSYAIEQGDRPMRWSL